MTPELERMLREENLCYITTYDAAGKPGTVEIWFVYEQGKLYISTGAQSVKVKKLRVTPRARVAIGRWKGPAVEGPTRLADEATVRRMVPLLSKKYDDYWGPVDQFTRRHLGTRPSRVLLEVMPSPPRQTRGRL
jgi:PPOX class probable F420-dependent enzyme